MGCNWGALTLRIVWNCGTPKNIVFPIKTAVKMGWTLHFQTWKPRSTSDAGAQRETDMETPRFGQFSSPGNHLDVGPIPGIQHVSLRWTPFLPFLPWDIFLRSVEPMKSHAKNCIHNIGIYWIFWTIEYCYGTIPYGSKHCLRRYDRYD